MIFQCKSSVYVRIITGGSILILFTSLASIWFIEQSSGVLPKIIISIALVAMLVYFYSRSLTELILDRENLYLKRPFDCVELSLDQIKTVKRISFSNLNLTTGSKGVFGFLGNTMDGKTCLVRDRKTMVYIKTLDRELILSCENVDMLIAQLNAVI